MERRYPDGCRPLVDVEREGLGVEWSAAMYELYAADMEWFGSPSVTYARSAERLASRLESSELERLDSILGVTWR